MTRNEFGAVMAYLQVGLSGSGKCLDEKTFEAMLDVYFDLLGDLPAPVFQLAAKRVLLEHRWATFPTVAELRQAAAETAQGQAIELSPAEAWQIAWKAAGKIDLDIDGSCERQMAALPPIVQQAMRAFSLPALVNGKEPLAVVRAQFIKIYEQLAARERRVALLPTMLREQLNEIGREHEQRQLPSRASKALAIVSTDAGKSATNYPDDGAEGKLAIAGRIPASGTFSLPPNDAPQEEAANLLAQFHTLPEAERAQWREQARDRFPGKSDAFLDDAAARLWRVATKRAAG